MSAVMKMGRKPRVHPVGMLRLENYLDLAAALPTAPPTWGYTRQIPSWPMMLNDSLGTCAIAAPGHMLQVWTQYAQGLMVTPTDAQILTAYSAVSGYVPGQPDTDTGCVMTDVLKYLVTTGIAGHQIVTWMAVPIANWVMLNLAGWLFGSVYVGLNLPLTAQTQIDAGYLWNTTGNTRGQAAPGTWGGHAVPIVAGNGKMFWSPTWTIMQAQTQSFWNAYGDEAYVILTQDWINAATQVSPPGFDMPALLTDIGAVAA